jgi:hypothetical protein
MGLVATGKIEPGTFRIPDIHRLETDSAANRNEKVTKKLPI